jgi:hypothetical protein
MAFMGACVSNQWIWDTPQPTATTIYFVGVSPGGLDANNARNLARADVVNQVAQHLGTEVENELHIKSSNQGTAFEGDVRQQGQALVERVIWVKYYHDSRSGAAYVLGSLDRRYVSQALAALKGALR